MSTRFKNPFWLAVGQSSDVNFRICEFVGLTEGGLEAAVPTEDGNRSGVRIEDFDQVLTILRSTISGEVKIYRCFPWMEKAKLWKKHSTCMRRRARYSRKPPNRSGPRKAGSKKAA